MKKGSGNVPEPFVFCFELALRRAVAAVLMPAAAVLRVFRVIGSRLISAAAFPVLLGTLLTILAAARLGVFAGAAVHGGLAVLAAFLAAIHILAFAAGHVLGSLNILHVLTTGTLTP